MKKNKNQKLTIQKINNMKTQKLVIWENTQAIKNHRLAYESFISSLKVNLDHLKAITGQKLDEAMFRDALTGCEALKENIKKQSEAKIQAEPDGDLKELFAEKLEAKIKKIEQISEQIQKAKQTKSTALDSVFIDAKLLSFKNGHIIFDEKPIIEMYSISLDTEQKQCLYGRAENIQNLIQEFEIEVQGLTGGQFHCINYAGFSDRIFLQLADDYTVEINPFAYDAIKV